MAPVKKSASRTNAKKSKSKASVNEEEVQEVQQEVAKPSNKKNLKSTIGDKEVVEENKEIVKFAKNVEEPIDDNKKKADRRSKKPNSDVAAEEEPIVGKQKRKSAVEANNRIFDIFNNEAKSAGGEGEINFDAKRKSRASVKKVDAEEVEKMEDGEKKVKVNEFEEDAAKTGPAGDLSILVKSAKKAAFLDARKSAPVRRSTKTVDAN